MNLYAYAKNNPLNVSDPNGLAPLMRVIFDIDIIQPLPGAIERADVLQEDINRRYNKIDKRVQECLGMQVLLTELGMDIGVEVARLIAILRGEKITGQYLIPGIGRLSTSYTLISFEIYREECMKDNCYQ